MTELNKKSESYSVEFLRFEIYFEDPCYFSTLKYITCINLMDFGVVLRYLGPWFFVCLLHCLLHCLGEKTVQRNSNKQYLIMLNDLSET